MPNAWIQHVKKFARDNNMAYACAISDPRCKSSYKKPAVAKAMVRPAVNVVVEEEKKSTPPPSRIVEEKKSAPVIVEEKKSAPLTLQEQFENKKKEIESKYEKLKDKVFREVPREQRLRANQRLEGEMNEEIYGPFDERQKISGELIKELETKFKRPSNKFTPKMNELKAYEYKVRINHLGIPKPMPEPLKKTIRMSKDNKIFLKKLDKEYPKLFNMPNFTRVKRDAKGVAIAPTLIFMEDWDGIGGEESKNRQREKVDESTLAQKEWVSLPKVIEYKKEAGRMRDIKNEKQKGKKYNRNIEDKFRKDLNTLWDEMTKIYGYGKCK